MSMLSGAPSSPAQIPTAEVSAAAARPPAALPIGSNKISGDSTLALETPVPSNAVAQPQASILHDFVGGTDGFAPYAGLIRASDGNFYGTTQGGGPGSGGTVFEVTPDGQYTLIYGFNNGEDGGQPHGTLIEATDGYLYGTTSLDGGSGGGTIFRIDLATHALKTVYHFNRQGFPIGDLIDDGSGLLYGTAFSGGTKGDGSVYSWSYETGSFHTLYSFKGESDGLDPQGGVVLASDGVLYGTARYGGSYNDTGLGDGTAFALNTDGTGFTAFYEFSNGVKQPDGYEPTQKLVEGQDGNLYGTTNGGNPFSGGSFFRIVPSGATSTLIALLPFDPAKGQGANAYLGAPMLRSNGEFYVVGSEGGAHGDGQIMLLDTEGRYSDAYDFGTNSDQHATTPYSGVIEGPGGNLFGTTSNGGADQGTVYEIAAALPPAITLTASPATVDVGDMVTLTWAAKNVFSRSASVCVARSSDAAFGGNGSAGIREITGSETVKAETAGTVLYAFTCGGIETATATVTVRTIPTKTAITQSTTLLTYGQGGAFTVTVSPATRSGIPTGVVTLKNGSETLASGALAGGVANLALPAKSLTPGQYTLTVVSSGDSTFSASTSTPILLTVHKLTPSVAFTLSPASLVKGAPAMVSVQVANGGVTVPAGTVVFSSRGVTLAQAPLVDGSAVLTLNTLLLNANTYPIIATYQGDGYDASVASASQTLTVTKADVQVRLTGPATAKAGSHTAFTVTVVRPNLGGAATGKINLLIGTKVVGSASLSGGTATVTVTLPASGTSAELTAEYLGDANNNTAASAPYPVRLSSN